MLILYSIGNLLLFFFFLKAKYIPRWLSVWGILASILVLVGGALQMGDMEVHFALFAQNGILMLFFTAWLLVVGFKANVSTAH